MAASGYTPISLYYSTTASAVPTSGNLANGELGLNINDMKLYAKNSSGVVTLLASNASTGATVSSVSGTGTVNGLTLTGTVTTSGSLTLGGTLSLVSPPPIGSTTPNTGAFTTLSAGNTTLTGTSALTINRPSAQGQITFQNNGTTTGILISGVTNGLVFYDGAAGLQMGTWAYAAGLAVTGTLSATQTTTTRASTNTYTNGNLVLLDAGGSNPWGIVSIGGNLYFGTGTTDKFVLGAAGQFGIGTNYGTSGQVLTSGGASAAPTWTTPSTASGTVTSVTVSAGTGMSGGGTVTTSGTITLTNAGVTSVTAGTGISVSASTGSVTITSTAASGAQAFVAFGTTGGF